MSKTVLVSGANGFVAAALLPHLVAEGWTVRAGERCPGPAPRCPGPRCPGVIPVAAPDLGIKADWRQAVAGCDTVIHVAARVHVMKETVADPLTAFRAVNTDGTFTLARQAAEQGVKRLVFVSTIKVNGETTPPDHPFQSHDPVNPGGPYAQSKAEAEEALWSVCRDSGLDGVVVRPPLVYGRGVKGNFASLLSAVRRRLPLPFGLVNNRRSLISVNNLASALVLCASHPAAVGQTFLVSDGEDVSTATLIRRMAACMGMPPRLLPIPPTLLGLFLKAAGKETLIPPLLESLAVDSTPLRQDCGWQPIETVDQALTAALQ